MTLMTETTLPRRAPGMHRQTRAEQARRRVPAAPGEMSHGEILRAMTGLLAALFTAMLSSTIVATALPTIIADLRGTQSQYTWVITASLLATTVSTPIWGKLADLFSKKVLVQGATLVFVAGSVAAGLSTSVPFLIACRVVQGLGMGGLTALSAAIMGAIVAPRERGRYSGYMGAVMAVSTVSGPLLGGFVVDSLGWRWTFYVCVPLAVAALVILQLQLHLHSVPRRPRIDYAGALLISVTASLPLLWVTFAGTSYTWLSWQSGAFVVATAVGVLLTLRVERRAPEPLIPLDVLANRTAVLAIVASVAVGIAMFGGTTFLGQYFQVAQGLSPTKAGLMTVPLMVAAMVSSTACGQIISRTGRWKSFLVGGAALLVLGLLGLSTVRHDTSGLQSGVAMAVMGLGMGALMQNLVLAVQNTVDVRDIGAASAAVSFFRSLGGAVGVSALGAVLANTVSSRVMEGLAALGPAAAGAQSGGAQTLDLKDMPAAVATVVRTAYGDATGQIFLVAAVVAVAALGAVLLIREVPLRTTVTLETPENVIAERA